MPSATLFWEYTKSKMHGNVEPVNSIETECNRLATTFEIIRSKMMKQVWTKIECHVIPDVSDDPALTQDMVYLILQSMF
jgi:hypothetical protein